MLCKPAIASMSLGRASVHDFHVKLKEASGAGFKGVEIFYEDLECLSKKYMEVGDAKESPMSDESALLCAAQEARKVCDEVSLEVIGLQPFLFYEGLIDRNEQKAKIQKLQTWFKIAHILGTDLIQIPSNFQPSGISGDLGLIVEDLQEVADLGLRESPPVRFAYENLAWGTHVDTWSMLWTIIQQVDRPNFGCCLDTFNIAGRVWADPTSSTGMASDADEKLNETFLELVRTIDVDKVFYLQLSDAERMTSPLVEGHPFHVNGQPPRMSWSKNARLFLYEQDQGGYLPVVHVAKTFLKDLGYSSWVSMEIFSRTMFDPSPDTPRVHAQRGFQSWRKLTEELGIET